MNEPLILAVDASTHACTVAVGHGEWVVQRHQVAPRGHAGLALPMVEAVLTEAGVGRRDIGLIATGHGPGAFTGVRISVGLAQGLALALGVPVVGLSTLAVLAQGCRRRLGTTRVCVALDARMGEVYWGVYELDPESGLMVTTIPDRVLPPEQATVPAAWRAYAATGPGWAVHGDAIGAAVPRAPERIEEDALPEARDMVAPAREAYRRGESKSAMDLAPAYIRNRVV